MLDHLSPGAYENRQPRRVVWPEGTLKINEGETIVIDEPVRIDASRTTLQVAKGVDAIRFTASAQGSTIEGAAIRYEAGGSSNPDWVHDGVAIDVQGADISILGGQIEYAGTGVRVDTSSGEYNCNGTRVADLRIIGNLYFSTGVLINGRDSNGGSYERLNVSGCKRGIVESSFLGNTHIGHMLHACPDGGYIVEGPANYSAFISCYAENDARPVCQESHGVTWIGSNCAQYTDIAGNRVSIRSALSFNNGSVGVKVPYGDGQPLGWDTPDDDPMILGTYKGDGNWAVRRRGIYPPHVELVRPGDPRLKDEVDTAHLKADSVDLRLSQAADILKGES
jgi:hypothetical protein